MKQRLFIFVALALVIAVLIGLNAVSHVQKPETVETEAAPNRSTFNPGTTGTQAFYSLLHESGRKVERWQRPTDELLTEKRDTPATLVMIGTLRRSLASDEAPKLLEWVSRGGRLVVIDRAPPQELRISSANWKIDADQYNAGDLLKVSSSDVKQMTAETPAQRPVQPTVFTQAVNAVQPSRFAASIIFERFSDGSEADRNTELLSDGTADDIDEPLSETSGAPVVHLGSSDRNILVDVPFGSGSIIFLSDPFVVANGGISLVDNAQLAINIVSAGNGLIAFDEYHQGYGQSNNRLFQYFSGTPVIAVFVQIVLLVGLLFLSQSRRFARPVQKSEPDRLSKLEYVGAMADLQRRTGAYDLALDNIFSDFRRRVNRHLGVDNTADDHKTAQAIAERIGGDPSVIEDLFAQCESLMYGSKARKRDALHLVKEIRTLEEGLGLSRARRGFEARRK
jgi:hypothetical protein